LGFFWQKAPLPACASARKNAWDSTAPFNGDAGQNILSPARRVVVREGRMADHQRGYATIDCSHLSKLLSKLPPNRRRPWLE
jgi:hypothetical protein